MSDGGAYYLVDSHEDGTINTIRCDSVEELNETLESLTGPAGVRIIIPPISVEVKRV